MNTRDQLAEMTTSDNLVDALPKTNGNETLNFTLSSANGTTPTSTIDWSSVILPYFILLGIVIVVGYITNTISIVVFIRSKSLRQSTTGMFLVSLAVADTLFLFGDMLRWLDTKNFVPGYTFRVLSDSSCQFVYSLRYSAKLTSAWLTVIIAAERCFIVAFPLRAGSVCTRKNALIAIVANYILWFTAGSMVSFTMKVMIYNNRTMCGYHSFDGYTVFNWIVLRVGSLILPGVVVMILTICIIVNLTKARIVRHHRLSHNQVQLNGNRRSQTSRMETQLTAMLLAVAIVFIALRLPYTVCYFLNDKRHLIWDPSDPAFNRIYVAYRYTDLLATLNYAVNFFLYCLSGSTFRRQFVNMFGCAAPSDAPPTMTAYGRNTITSQTYHGLSVRNQGSLNVVLRKNSRGDTGSPFQIKK